MVETSKGSKRGPKPGIEKTPQVSEFRLGTKDFSWDDRRRQLRQSRLHVRSEPAGVLNGTADRSALRDDVGDTPWVRSGFPNVDTEQRGKAR